MEATGSKATASAPPAGGADVKVKMPIQVSIPRTEEKSGYVTAYTAYCIQVVDFGRPYTVEKRYDDFNKLYADLSGLVDEGALPPLPEKRMFSSTNAEVVAERKPQLEKLLKYALRREEIVFDTGHCLSKFLEIPVGAMVCLRYLMSKGKKHSYTRQCWKLLEKQFVQEHAWRLCHESVIRMNLHLMSTEGAFVVSPTSASTPAAAEKSNGTASAQDSTAADGAGSDAEASPPAKLTEADLETGVIDMIKHAITEGDAETRKCFMEEKGLFAVLGMMLRLVKKTGEEAGPDKRLKEVLTVLIRAEGDHFPALFASFLTSGGIAQLGEFKDLCAAQASFAEFMGKVLWLAWDGDTQKAFLQASSSAEGLAVLAALFGSGSKSGQLLAGLLLSTLIANRLFMQDQEAKASAGVAGLVEDLVLSMPIGLSQAKSGAVDEDLKAAEAVIASTSRTERNFLRIVDVACAPCTEELSEEHPLWSACSFALWFLAKAQAAPERISRLRPILPSIAGSGPHRARWLVGQLLLQIHTSTGSQNVPAAQFSSQGGIGAEGTFQEQTVVEVALAEQVEHESRALQASLEEHRKMIAQQKELTEERRQSIADGHGMWSADVSSVLARLSGIRKQLSDATSTLQDKERNSAESLASLSDTLKVDSRSTRAEAEQTLQQVQDLEGVYLNKKADLDRCDEELQVQTSVVDQCSADVEESDKSVAAMRKRVSDMEQEASSKQREAQYHRTLASSDLTAIKGQLTDERDNLDKKMAAIKEKGQKLKADDQQGTDAAKTQEALAKLRQDLQQCKQRHGEVLAELQRLQADPATIQQTAARLDAEAADLLDQLGVLRSQELMQLEQAHNARRETWQREASRLQDVRFRRDAAERECSDLRRQVDDRWQLWRPVWSARLSHWSSRVNALSAAQAHSKRLDEALQKNWSLFQAEQGARTEVLQVVEEAQRRLVALAEQVASVGNL